MIELTEEQKQLLDDRGLTYKWFSKWADRWKLTTDQVKYALDYDVKFKHEVMDIFHIG